MHHNSSKNSQDFFFNNRNLSVAVKLYSIICRNSLNHILNLKIIATIILKKQSSVLGSGVCRSVSLEKTLVEKVCLWDSTVVLGSRDKTIFPCLEFPKDLQIHPHPLV